MQKRRQRGCSRGNQKIDGGGVFPRKKAKRKYKISVITPSLNQADFIRENIESIANQTAQAEHIVMDGGSDDGTIAILEEYPDLVWRTEPDRGQSHALNKAMALAKGDIIGWLNADDIYTDGALAKVLDFFEDNPDANVLVGDCLFFYEDGRPDLLIRGRELDFGQMIRYWDPSLPPAQPVVFFRKSVFERAGEFDESLSLAMDYDFWLRAAKENKFHYIPETLAKYRFHGQSKSGRGEDWSHFYPEWHQVYLRYKQFSELPAGAIMTFVIPDREGQFSEKIIQNIAKFRLKDIEALIITQSPDLSISSEYNFPVEIINLNNWNAAGFDRAVIENSEGMFAYVLSNEFRPPENWFYLSINHLLDNPDKNQIAEQRLAAIPNSAPSEIFRPDRVVRLSSITLQNEIKISVIIPTFNRSDILIKCLEALARQTLASDELEAIVIDDGSTDDTRAQIESFSAPFDLKYIHQENAGPGAARNRGIDAARGEFVLIINDDTIAAADLLERHLEAQSANRGRRLAVLGTFDYIAEARRRPFVNFMQRSSMVFAYPVMKGGEVYPYRFFWTCNISIERSALIEAGKFDEDFSDPMIEDTELGWRLEKLGWRVLYLPEARSMHHHSIDAVQFARRQWMSGKNSVKLFRKHPDLLEKEKKLFGFDNLGPDQIRAFKREIERMRPAIPQIMEGVREIDRFDVIDGDYVVSASGEKIPWRQIESALNQAAWNIHYSNFYKGIVHQYEAESGAVEEFKPEPLPDLAIEKDDRPAILMTMYGWGESGGGSLFPASLAQELARRGWRVGVFYAIKKEDKSRPPFFLEIRRDGDIYLFGLGNRSAFFSDTANPLREVEDAPAVRRFAHVLKTFRPDVVHFHNFLGFSFAIADEVRSANIPSVFTPHNYHLIDPALYMFRYDKMRSWSGTDFFANSEFAAQNPEKLSEYRQRIKAAQDMLNSKIDLTCAISDRVRDIFIEFGINENKISTIHQIPEYIKDIQNKSREKSSSQKLRVGYLGAVIAHKGAHVLIQAMQSLDPSRAECRIYGEINEIYRREIVKLDRRDICKLEGSYDLSDLPAIGRELDLVVVPSLWEEGAGLVVVEALAMGIPVIASKMGGMRDFVCDGVNGRLFDPYDPNSLSRILTELQADPSIIGKWRANCSMSHYFSDYSNRIELIYKKLIDGVIVTPGEAALKFKC
ncbi:MAG: glycosyltransferase [Candidatus Kapaibacterium sp.]